MTATITLTTPAAVVAALPRLAGYVPAGQVAVVAMAGRRVGFVSVAPPAIAREWAVSGRADRAMAQARITRAIVVGYDVTDADTRAVADGLPVLVLDTLAVAGGRWRSLDCTDPDCCPAEGTPIDDTDPQAAELVGLTGHVHPSREAKAATFAADPWTLAPSEDVLARTGLPARDREAARLLIAEAVGLARLARPTRADLIRLAGLMEWNPARDTVLRESAGTAATGLVAAARHIPDPAWRAKVAGAAACALYLAGDGMGAGALLALAGDDSLGALVGAALDAGMDPACLAEALAAIDDEEILARAGL